ncbi:Hypothetical predicted protein [Mytilus galloprovincialis]|uniref:Myogenesis-regulating glycosidase n=1 Tax=Mytilus galloprovincialis TaxID=29158 RepID=A0A8B6DQ81_MYTGA|nr:Hypothetical predicted protein [Mytilus galloprovincialis]
MSGHKINGRMKVGLALLSLILLSAIVGIIAWQVGRNNNEEPEIEDEYVVGNLHLEKYTWNFKIKNSDTDVRLSGQLSNTGSTKIVAEDCGSSDNVLCLDWIGTKDLLISYNKYVSAECYDIYWRTHSCSDQILLDCFDLDNAHWYGGYEDWNQFWPLEQTTMNLSAFVANDSYAKRIGGVQERYFINSQGIGINISSNVPLYIRINQTSDKQICLMAKYEKYPYTNIKGGYPHLSYTICVADNVRKIHEFMSASFSKPSDIPDRKLFKYPIWSTWAQYHKDINQTTVIEFASNILKYNFSHSQVEIDDDWTPKYGDMVFNVKKFPNATEMVKQLNAMGFRVTIWVHPFFNIDSLPFQEAASQFFLVRQYDSQVPALVSWWDGNAAGILDVSNKDAVQWFIEKLQFLQKTYNISSFKFDAGETNWLPNIFETAYDSPNFYPTKWAELAYASDTEVRHQEVRVGVSTQHLPVFVRMLDKNSNWENKNGLKTLINTALTFGLLGYPFVLPDMIGGNAYEGNKPDRELFIRWLEATALLPAMQFSIVPWQYDDEVVNISRKFVQLHEEYSDLIIKLAEESVRTGAPIIRPLWWISPLDKECQRIDTEFLLGNNTLVAPVLEQGAISRDIYLPLGRWRASIDGRVINGPEYLRNYSVKLDELPIFTRLV